MRLQLSRIKTAKHSYVFPATPAEMGAPFVAAADASEARTIVVR